MISGKPVRSDTSRTAMPASAIAFADELEKLQRLRDQGSLSDEEFRRRFHWIARKRPGASREELERLVSLYHCGRQEATGSALCCDIETREHDGCDGWNSFDNRSLEEFFLKMTGHPARIG